jgi:signal transduction histidine kinase/DNA-binding response OmpR family regulator
MMRVLLVEENHEDALLVGEMLAEAGARRSSPIDLTHADRLSSAVSRLQKDGADAVLLTLSLPDGRGLEVFTAVHAAAPEVPCIVLATLADEPLAAEAVRRGAQDYLVKGELTAALLRRTIDAVLERSRLLARLQALLAAQPADDTASAPGATAEHTPASQPAELEAAIVKNFPIGITVFRLDDQSDPLSMRMVMANPAASVAAGAALDTLVGRRLDEAFPALVDSDVPRRLASVVHGGLPAEMGEIRTCKEPERDRIFAVRAFPLFNRLVGVALEDVTERVRLTEQLHQSQKMDAVSRLAGGVAHDFNNLLMVIKSFGGFVKEALQSSDPASGDIDEVLSAADEAVELVRRLLSFARRQPIEPKIVNLGGIVLGMRSTLQRVLGEGIELVTRPVNGLWHVKIDPRQVDQVLLNLATNARDAMPGGGKLTIELSNVVLGAAFAAEHGGMAPGEYVLLAVADTGEGMTADVQARAFEPFFTTKDQGRGRGLGLSTCYGNVKQARGHIWVYSDLHRGTTVKIYLPRALHGVAPSAGPVSCDRRLRGSETVLVLEDEPAVRTAIVRTLKLYGYRVLDAEDAGKALLLCERYTARIDLLITDIVMPGMSGPQFVERVAPVRPEMKALYVSGCAEGTLVQTGVLSPFAAFLAKPFTSRALARRVRDVLELPQGGNLAAS